MERDILKVKQWVNAGGIQVPIRDKRCSCGLDKYIRVDKEGVSHIMSSICDFCQKEKSTNGQHGKTDTDKGSNNA